MIVGLTKGFTKKAMLLVSDFFDNYVFANMERIRYDVIRDYFIANVSCGSQPYFSKEQIDHNIEYLIRNRYEIEIDHNNTGYKLRNTKENKEKMEMLLNLRNAKNIEYQEDDEFIHSFHFSILPRDAGGYTMHDDLVMQFNLKYIADRCQKLNARVQKALYEDFNCETYTFECFQERGSEPVYKLYGEWIVDPEYMLALEQMCKKFDAGKLNMRTTKDVEQVFDCVRDEDWIYPVYNQKNIDTILELAKKNNFVVALIQSSNYNSTETPMIKEIELTSNELTRFDDQND